MGKPRLFGADTRPRARAALPDFRDNFDGPNGVLPDARRWRVAEGDWRQRNGELVQGDPGARSATAQIVGVASRAEYLFEANARLLAAGDGRGRYGAYIDHGPGDRTLITLAADGSGLRCEQDSQGAGRRPIPLSLNRALVSAAYHRLRVSARGGRLEARVDGVRVARGIETPRVPPAWT